MAGVVTLRSVPRAVTSRWQGNSIALDVPLDITALPKDSSYRGSVQQDVSAVQQDLEGSSIHALRGTSAGLERPPWKPHAAYGGPAASTIQPLTLDCNMETHQRGSSASVTFCRSRLIPSYFPIAGVTASTIFASAWRMSSIWQFQIDPLPTVRPGSTFADRFLVVPASFAAPAKR